MDDPETSYPDGGAAAPGDDPDPDAGDDLEDYDGEPFPDEDPDGADDDGPRTPGRLPVILPSGARFPVLTQMEVDLLNERVERYNSDNHFTNSSDLASLDNLLIQEMFVFRWSYWLSTGCDYSGDDVNEQVLQRHIAEYSKEIRQLKNQLGIDKTSRDRSKGEDSISEYLITLRQRAREFGIHRDMQTAKIIELGMQLIALLQFHDNCLEDERREFGCTVDDVFSWIRETFTTEFMELDAHFRLNQKMWIRSM